MFLIQSAPMADENVASREEEKDCNLTMAERVCVLNSSEEEGDLNAFVSESYSPCVRGVWSR